MEGNSNKRVSIPFLFCLGENTFPLVMSMGFLCILVYMIRKGQGRNSFVSKELNRTGFYIGDIFLKRAAEKPLPLPMQL